MLPCRYGALACWYVTSQIKSCVEIPYLSLWTKSIDCLSLFASLPLIFLCSPPHLTPQHVFSLCLFFCFSVFFVFFFWFIDHALLRNTESLYLPYLKPHTVPQYLCDWVSTYLFTADKLFQTLVPMSTDSPLSKAISCPLSKVRWLAEIMRKSYIIMTPQHYNRLFL